MLAGCCLSFLDKQHMPLRVTITTWLPSTCLGARTHHKHELLLLCCDCCSFVKELQALRRKLEGGSDAAADFSLVSLVRALRDNAGSIKEGAHDAVLTTVLSISLWSCSTVSDIASASVQHMCRRWFGSGHGILQLASAGAARLCVLTCSCSPCAHRKSPLSFQQQLEILRSHHSDKARTYAFMFAHWIVVGAVCCAAECAQCCAGLGCGAHRNQQHIHRQLPAGEDLPAPLSQHTTVTLTTMQGPCKGACGSCSWWPSVAW
jgi:hypothetical protein